MRSIQGLGGGGGGAAEWGIRPAERDTKVDDSLPWIGFSV
jgi:hypothetical protein